MLREADSSETHMGVGLAYERASLSMAALRGNLVLVRAFVSALETNKARNELRETIADAETLPAKTVLALADSLSGALKTSEAWSETVSPYPLRKLNIAINTLAGLITRDVFTSMRYPSGDETTTLQLMRSREAQAINIHNDVAEAVADVADALGIALPEPPALSLPRAD
jgi:hypothetical protein